MFDTVIAPILPGEAKEQLQEQMNKLYEIIEKLFSVDYNCTDELKDISERLHEIKENYTIRHHVYIQALANLDNIIENMKNAGIDLDDNLYETVYSLMTLYCV